MRRETYTQQAYAELRTRILDGTLGPGSRLVVRVLAEELDISPTPIKQAMAMLTREGLLINIPHRGFVVPEPDPVRVAEAFEVLAALDQMAVTKVAAAPDRTALVAELQAIVALEWAGSSPPPAGPYPGYQFDFHRPIWHGAGNEQLAEITEGLTGLLLVASGGLLDAAERSTDIAAEHLELAALIAAGNADAARDLARRHLERTARATLDRIARRDATAAPRAEADTAAEPSIHVPATAAGTQVPVAPAGASASTTAAAGTTSP